MFPGISSLLSGQSTKRHLAFFDVRHIRYLSFPFGRQPLSYPSAWIGSIQVRVLCRMLQRAGEINSILTPVRLGVLPSPCYWSLVRHRLPSRPYDHSIDHSCHMHFPHCRVSQVLALSSLSGLWRWCQCYELLAFANGPSLTAGCGQ
jgi:hypothetical protein